MSTKQSRRTAARKERQRQAAADFLRAHPGASVQGRFGPIRLTEKALVAAPERVKQKLVEQFGR